MGSPTLTGIARRGVTRMVVHYRGFRWTISLRRIVRLDGSRTWWQEAYRGAGTPWWAPMPPADGDWCPGDPQHLPNPQ